MALDHSCQVQRHTLAERGLDLYETPLVAVEALLRYEKLPHQIWEPAAGRGAIVRVLRDAGHAVIASDIQDYGFPLHFVRDFLTETAMPSGCELILTNPPFNIIAKFVARSLELSPRVIVLARLAFLEAGELGSKRLDRHLRSLVLDGGRLARIYNFRIIGRRFREERQLRNGLRVVLLRPARRSANDPSNLLGETGTGRAGTVARYRRNHHGKSQT
jgi:hypothetical protein